MIRINDRQDPNQASVVLVGAEPVDVTGNKRSFSTPANEFTARLTTGGPANARFLVCIGDPVGEEGAAPDVWYGVVESWRPLGSKLLINCRVARTAEELVHSADPVSVPGSPISGPAFR